MISDADHRSDSLSVTHDGTVNGKNLSEVTPDLETVSRCRGPFQLPVTDIFMQLLRIQTGC